MKGQLEALRKEKSELLGRVKKIKDAAKEGQEKSGVMYVYPKVCLATY